MLARINNNFSINLTQQVIISSLPTIPSIAMLAPSNHGEGSRATTLTWPTSGSRTIVGILTRRFCSQISTRDSISSNSCASNNSDVPRGPSNLHRWLITVEAVSRREYCRGVNAACKRIGHRLFFHPTRAAIKPKVI